MRLVIPVTHSLVSTTLSIARLSRVPCRPRNVHPAPPRTCPINPQTLAPLHRNQYPPRITARPRGTINHSNPSALSLAGIIPLRRWALSPISRPTLPRRPDCTQRFLRTLCYLRHLVPWH
ncbi:hypothetical protein EI94DRAFT_554090 [Lactarius quietus]|nr:hypothetical protein EI94DRAFT_554090 [Lactarius quietus]